MKKYTKKRMGSRRRTADSRIRLWVVTGIGVCLLQMASSWIHIHNYRSVSLLHALQQDEKKLAELADYREKEVDDLMSESYLLASLGKDDHLEKASVESFLLVESKAVCPGNVEIPGESPNSLKEMIADLLLPEPVVAYPAETLYGDWK